jgi:hypothetical protein
MSKLITSTGFNSNHALPKPIEAVERGQDYIKWGSKNDYPFFLIDMYGGSAWHQGILKTKTYYIAGGGIEVVSGQLEELIENKYSDFRLDEVMKKCAFDFELFDAFAVCGTWNKEGTRVVRWEHIDIDDIRMNEDESMYYLSDDWSARKQTPEKTNFREIAPLNMMRKSGKFLIYYKSASKKSKGELGLYPKPNYSGGLTAINTDYLISRYHLFEISNGFKGGTLINLANGQPQTREEADAIRDQIKGDTVSVEDANEVIITFSDGNENAPSVLSLNGNDLADRYNLTEKAVQQNILVAHSATNPLLFGIKTEGQLGGTTELLESYEIFKSLYVQARQECLEYVLNKMVKLSGLQGELRLKEAKPVMIEESVDNVQPIADGEGNTEEVVAETGDVQGTALNGAQISSMVAIVEAVGLGTLTPESAVQVILASFPLIAEEEARKIVGIGNTPTSTLNEFRSAEKDLKVFAEYGADKKNFTVVRSISVSNDFTSADVAKMEQNNFGMMFDAIGDIIAGLSDLDKNVLSMLIDGEDGGAISSALDAPLSDVAKSIDKLTNLNLLVDGRTTEIGQVIIDREDIDIEQYEVRYSYEVKPGLGAEKIPTTRPFCETLIDLNKMYLRSEIDLISGRIGRDVWKYRGGFYHNPKTQRTTPYCRHEWKQSLVRKNA